MIYKLTYTTTTGKVKFRIIKDRYPIGSTGELISVCSVTPPTWFERVILKETWKSKIEVATKLLQEEVTRLNEQAKETREVKSWLDKNLNNVLDDSN